MSIDRFIQRGLSKENRKPFLEPDPSANLCILLRERMPSSAHPLSYEVAEVVRLRGFKLFSKTEKDEVSLEIARILIDRMNKVGSNGFDWLDMADAQKIMEGSNDRWFAKLLRLQDFSKVSVVDVYFGGHRVSSTEVKLLSSGRSKDGDVFEKIRRYYKNRA